MVDASNTLLVFTSKAFVFVIAELIEWLILIHDEAGWHFRFRSPEGYPNLRPLISTFKAAVILFLIVLVVSPFVLTEIWNQYVLSMIASSNYWILLFGLSVSFTFLWFWHHIAGKDWNNEQYLLAGVSILFFLGYLAANSKP